MRRMIQPHLIVKHRAVTGYGVMTIYNFTFSHLLEDDMLCQVQNNRQYKRHCSVANGIFARVGQYTVIISI